MSKYPIDPSTAPGYPQSSVYKPTASSHPQLYHQAQQSYQNVVPNLAAQPSHPAHYHQQPGTQINPHLVPSKPNPHIPPSQSNPYTLPSQLNPHLRSSHSNPHIPPSLSGPNIPHSQTQLVQGMNNLQMNPATQNIPVKSFNPATQYAAIAPNGQQKSTSVEPSAANIKSQISPQIIPPPTRTTPSKHSGEITSMLHAPTHPGVLNSQLNAPIHRSTAPPHQPQMHPTQSSQVTNMSTPPGIKPQMSPSTSSQFYPSPNQSHFLNYDASSQPWGQNIQRGSITQGPPAPVLPATPLPIQGQSQYPPTQQSGVAQFQNNLTPNPGSTPVLFPQHPMQTGPGQPRIPGSAPVNQFNQTHQQALPPELEPINLLDTRNILPKYIPDPPLPKVSTGVRTKTQFDPYMLCSTLNSIPYSKSLLSKSKLPLGVLIQPFRDIQSDKLPIVSTSCIIRCTNCRTYINPYISFLSGRKWKCNICHRANALPDGFNPDDAMKANNITGSYSEVQSPIVEYIANSDYALRPPQPPVYVFVLDVSNASVVSGALSAFCKTLIECIDEIPGDSRTQVGLITFNHSIQFYGIRGNLPAHIYDILDLEEVFLPTNNDLLVYLKEVKESFKQLLRDLPSIWGNSHSSDSCVGVAAESAYKMISQCGGRITILIAQRPTRGNGAMSSEQATSYLKKHTSNLESLQLSASTDFYKKLALDCCEKQVGVDVFVTCSQFTDLLSISALSRYSSGQVRYYPALSQESPNRIKAFQEDLHRYFTRRIGFEAVMRIRCSPGLALHTFHGNCFVRSTDLLALPNVNPDHSFAIQLSYEETLDEVEVAFVQSALLYTSVRGERRIRVATIALPVTTKLMDVYASANTQAIAAFVAKMAVDRLIESSLGDARTGLINVVGDLIKSYSVFCPANRSNSLTLPTSLRLLPLYLLGLLKHPLLRVNSLIQLDERSYQTILLKTLPLDELLSSIYPTLYSLHDIIEKSELTNELEGDHIIVQIMHCSAEKTSLTGTYLLDAGEHLILYLGANVSPEFLQKVFGVSSPRELVEDNSTSIKEFPVIENMLSERIRLLMSQIKWSRARSPVLMVLTDTSHCKMEFPKRLVEDKFEETMSYYEFLNFLRSKISK
ncbi:Protein transport protein Sec24B [Oopsacas minuta]|uniref:Protein transport protein Sec24B n=1 Tax=Oopsacas minuta TaxID=111878 RepID=A0AAV7JRQ5_9METZ|nr:Protein transport protein Sec24B [Oopsacas minuta]